MGATVINVSSIACVADAAALDDRALGAALAYAVDVKNVVVVAAAGNVGGLGQCPDQNPPADPAHPGQPDWDSVKVVVSPAWYDEYVLTVGSVDPHGCAVSVHAGGPLGRRRCSGRGGRIAGPRRRRFRRYAARLGQFDADCGDELRGAGGQWDRRTDTCTIAAPDRATGDAANQGHRASAPGRLGSVRRSRRRRRTGRSQRRHHHRAHDRRDRRVRDDDERPISPPASNIPPDPSARRIAFGGAGICVAVVAAAVALTASAGRLRRQEKTVARD